MYFGDNEEVVLQEYGKHGWGSHKEPYWYRVAWGNYEVDKDYPFKDFKDFDEALAFAKKQRIVEAL